MWTLMRCLHFKLQFKRLVAFLQCPRQPPQADQAFVQMEFKIPPKAFYQPMGGEPPRVQCLQESVCLNHVLEETSELLP